MHNYVTDKSFITMAFQQMAFQQMAFQQRTDLQIAYMLERRHGPVAEIWHQESHAQE